MAKSAPDKSVKRKRARKLPAHITYLEMHAHNTKPQNVPTRPSIALIHAQNIQAHFYSYMYELVGKPHHWEDRRDLSAGKLYETVNDPNVDISILYVEGCPAGFFELSLNDLPDRVEIKYLGIAPEYQGLGIGKWFCAAAISAAWSHKPGLIAIETNTLDHPAALPLYQKLGFSPVAVGDAKIKEWL